MKAFELSGKHIGSCVKFQTRVGQRGPIRWCDKESLGITIVVTGVVREVSHTVMELLLR